MFHGFWFVFDSNVFVFWFVLFSDTINLHFLPNVCLINMILNWSDLPVKWFMFECSYYKSNFCGKLILSTNTSRNRHVAVVDACRCSTLDDTCMKHVGVRHLDDTRTTHVGEVTLVSEKSDNCPKKCFPCLLWQSLNRCLTPIRHLYTRCWTIQTSV